MKTKRLSKSTIVTGHQCNKAFWLKIHKPKLAAEIDMSTQRRFDEGNEVGEAARKEFPKGHLIDKEYYQIEEALAETAEVIKKGGKVIMEASFASDDLYARADIIKKGKKGWDLIEVKMGTSAKPEYVLDAAIQAQILSEAGVKLESVSLMYLNNQCVFPDLSNLFKTEDVTDEVTAIRKNVEKKINELRKVATQKSEPKVAIGDHCSDPYECPFKEYCWKDEPVQKLKGTSAKAKVDVDLVREELESWEYPLYYFDFETLGPAIPRYVGTKPYGGIPFQFSCHVQSKAGAKVTHFEYLHQTPDDPRPGIIKAMIGGLGTTGSIVSYNKGFEIGVIKKLAEFDKKNSKKLLALIDRFVDPLPLVRKAVKHPDFVNGHSIKVVAPALLGSKFNYDDLEIGDGVAAQSYAEQILKGKIAKKDLDKVVANLLAYCRQDTMGMVELVNWLNRAIGD